MIRSSAEGAASSSTVRVGGEIPLEGPSPTALREFAASPRPQRLPLSYPQRRLWFLDQLTGGSPEYRLVEAVRIRGPFRMDAFARAIAAIVERHESLRSRFEDGALDGEPQQVIDPAGHVPVTLTDVQGVGAAGAIDTALEREWSEPFDLEHGPLVRLRVLRVGPRDHVVIRTCHHIIWDGWSHAVFNRELSVLYSAFCAGAGDPLPPLAVQYADFALWQRSRSADRSMREGVAYWTQQLADAPDQSRLPTDRPRPVRQAFRAAQHDLPLSAELTAGLRQTGRAHQATLFMTLVTGLSVLLARYSGQSDVVVATPVATRQEPELEDLIGLLVNRLAIRVRIPADATFASLLATVRTVALAAYRHQDVPFDRVVEAVAPERRLDATPLAQVSLAVQNTPGHPLTLSGADVEPLPSVHLRVRNDLEIHAYDRGGVLTLSWVYNTDLFDAWRIEQMARHYRRLLDALSATPGSLISGVELLDSAERHRLLTAWTGRHAAETACDAVTLVGRFAAQVAAAPDAVAIAGDEGFVSYAALARRSDGVAVALRVAGVGAEDRVIICIDRSVAMVVACLGVLRAGAAYVPVDVDLPTERRNLLVANSGASVVVVDRAGRSFDVPGTTVIALDAIPAREPDAPPTPAVLPAHAAYLLYTSGSTGRPKGVVVEHRQVVNYVDALHARTGWERGRHCAMVQPLSVDSSVTVLYGSLLGGGCLYPVPKEIALDAAAFSSYSRRHGIECLKIAPSHLAALQVGALSDPLPSRCLIVGGESSRPEWVAALLADSRCEVFNHYGPTEATVGVTMHKAHAARCADANLPIGRPLRGVHAYVVGPAMEPVPLGVTGMLLLGGACVARGYWRNAAGTAEAFLPDPFAVAAAGARVYVSGDVARWRHDHELEFLGRRDTQIKIRGYRVEPGEIEWVLRGDPRVRDALVQLRGPSTHQRLVAYVVPAGCGASARDAPWGGAAAAGLASQLQAAVRRRLPTHMVPAAIVLLDEWPRTSHGKVDTHALPEPDVPVPARENPLPMSDHEELLCILFAEVLNAPVVTPDSDFFQLGGHSLLAMTLVSRVRAVLSVDLPVRAVFEEPTPARLARHLRTASLSTRPLLAAHPFRPSRIPLSHPQQRLWFHDQLQGTTSPEYNSVHAVRVRGALDLGVLTRAVRTIVSRHESLRTRFAVVDGEPLQVIAAAAPVTVTVEDVTALAPAEWPAALDAAWRRERETPFDLLRGPLLRVHVIRMGGDDHAVVRTCHHIVSDGWSHGVFNRELSALYAAYRTGQPNPLQPLSVQYADFTLWQRGWLENGGLAAGLAYWTQQLAGAPERLRLPTDRPRPARQTFRAAQHELVVSADLLARLRQTGRAHDATLYMTLLTGLAVLLARYSGQADLLVGTPVANRGQAELEELIGVFVNTLAMRVRLPVDATFTTLLTAVRQTTLDAYRHQDVPFASVVAAVAPERRLDGTALTQVSFAVQNMPRPPLLLAGTKVTTLPRVHQRVRNDLEIHGHEREGLTVSWVFNTALFDGWRIEQMARHYERVLEILAAAPATPVATLHLLDPVERHRLLVDWAGPHRLAAVGGIENRTLVRRFAARAASMPDAIAIAGDAGQVTYATLARRAGRLARTLRAAGVHPEDRVIVAIERSPAMVVACLGVLGAGAAYVPIDPDLPPARRAMLLADTGASVVVVDGFQPAVDEGSATVVAVDPAAGSPPAARQPGLPAVAPAQAAYVLYTSGSTGRPKGVVVEHRQIVNYVDGLHQRVGWLPGLRCAMVQPLSVDASLAALYGSLLGGGCLHPVPKDVAIDARAFAGYLHRHQIECLKIAPSHLAALQEDTATGPLPVRMVILGGEPPRRAWLDTLLASSSCQVFNHYGPTETTVAVTMHDARAGSGSSGSLPIGSPLANIHAYVVDADFRPVPIGVTGTLALSGAGVARGYWQNPRETAAAFLPNPFGAGGARVYWTGDLVRWQPDGALQFLGRADHQIKLRGHRVELGEIEAALRQHPGILDAVVMSTGAGAAERLVAFVATPGAGASGVSPVSAVSGGAHAGFAADVQQFVRRLLPEHMVPAAVVALSEFPRTPHGKVDRRALRVPVSESRTPDPAEGTEEELLAAIFIEILGVQDVGPETDFFSAGGHSLMAMRLVSRIRSTFGVDLPIRAVFQTPTVAGLARALQTSALSGRPPLCACRRPATIPLSYAQQRLWFHDHLQGGSPEYNISQAVRVRGALQIGALRRALAALVARHETLRTHFAVTYGEPAQVIASAVAVPLPMQDLSPLDESDRAAAVNRAWRREREAPFDLERGPVLRLRLLRLSHDEHVLFRTCHHVVSDGWSQAVFNRDLSALYEAYCAGLDDPLPALPVQYADFAIWQRAWLDAGGLSAGLAYWTQQLADAPTRLRVPTDRPRPLQQTFRAAQHVLTIPAELTSRLRQTSRTHQATLYMTLLAGLSVLLGRYSGQADLVIGAPVANRQDPQLEHLIGFFVNTLPMRVRLAAEGTFTSLLAAVRQTALDAYRHQDVPFEQVVEAVAPTRSLDTSPLVQVLLVLQNMPRQTLRFGDASVEAVEGAATRVRYDFELHVVERDGALALRWLFNDRLFDRWRVEQMARHHARVLHALSTEPESVAATVSLLSGPERSAVLVAGEGPTVLTVPPLVRRWSETLPARDAGAVAISCGDRRLSYAEVYARAYRLARTIHAAEPKGEFVGIFTDDRVQLAIAVGAAIVAGIGFIPFDAALPDERLGALIAQSGAPVLLADEHWRDRLSHLTGATVVAMDDEPPPAPHEWTPPPVDWDARPAYMYFTSGSTGGPKAIVGRMRSLEQFMAWEIRTLALDRGTRVSQLIRPSFDAYLRDLFAAWSAGGTLCIPPDADRMTDPQQLVDWLAGEQVSLVHCSPTLLRLMLADEGAGAVLPHLRFVLSSGEPLLAADVQRWNRIMGERARLVNLYGATETTLIKFAHLVTPADAAGAVVPVGRPLPGASVVVLDRTGDVSPLGVSGEIAVCTPYSTFGYHRDPGRTAEVFVPHPHGRPGEVVYRTGDIGRLLPGGTVELEGRRDGQIKIRGQRVELGEVEDSIQAQDGVRHAVVVARDLPDGDRRLIAYVVGQGDVGEWKRAVQRRLPAYMVPAVWMRLDRLPLTRTGKVDRNALPPPVQERETRMQRPARTAEEEVLCALFAEVLETPFVGPEDDFFELGGHSLMAARLVARIRAACGVDLPMHAMFETPHVYELAAQISAVKELAGDAVLPLRPTGSLPPVFFVSAEPGMNWTASRLMPHIGKDHPIFALTARGGTTDPSVSDGVDDCVARIRSIHAAGPYCLAASGPGAPLAHAIACRMRLGGLDVPLVAVIDPVTPTGSSVFDGQVLLITTRADEEAHAAHAAWSSCTSGPLEARLLGGALECSRWYDVADRFGPLLAERLTTLT